MYMHAHMYIYICVCLGGVEDGEALLAAPDRQLQGLMINDNTNTNTNH